MNTKELHDPSLKLGDVRCQNERNGRVHVIVPRDPNLVPTLCGANASGPVWWRDMPVTSNPPAFTEEPAINCPTCLDKMRERRG